MPEIGWCRWAPLALLLLLSTSRAAGHRHRIPVRQQQQQQQQPEQQLQSNETRVKPLISTAERLAEHGYASETHSVRTEDGYILTMFRIASSPRWQDDRTRQRRPVVLLMHCLLCTSDFWLLNGPEHDLAFLLADAGYDVWLPNARGSHYSQSHATLGTASARFWRFSWHEIGHYDLPALIDYAVDGQGQQAVHYVAHSQGTTVLLVLLATRPEYNAKVKTAQLLAPVAYMDHSSSQLLRMLSPYLGYGNTISRIVSSHQFVPYNDILLLVFFNTCGRSGVFYDLCSKLLPALIPSMGRQNETMLTSMLEVYPGGSSTDQILHYLQLHRSGHFRPFDFGRPDNHFVYGQKDPPAYRLEDIVARLHLWYGDNDTLVAVEDVQRLAARLPNRVMHHMEDPLWTHGDFLFYVQVRELINVPLMAILDEYEHESNVVRT